MMIMMKRMNKITSLIVTFVTTSMIATAQQKIDNPLVWFIRVP